MKRAWLAMGLCVCASGCAGQAEGSVERTAVVVAQAQVHGGQGDVWGLLYRPGQGFPGPPAAPVLATAVSAQRLASGNGRLIFAAVEPNPWRLWAFLDVDGDFDPQVDVLAQPGAGDHLGSGVEINVQPGREQSFAVDIAEALADEPPAFRLETPGDEVLLSETPGAPTVLTLVRDDLGGALDARHLGFRVGLIDEDGNGVPEDLDGDGAPDLWPRAFLRWLPRPGQGEDGAEVLLPMFFNAAPFLSELGADLSRSLVVDRLQYLALGQAQKVATDAAGKVTSSLIAAAPAGEYELVLYARTGQYWRLPNDLAGRHVGQGVRFRVDRNSR